MKVTPFCFRLNKEVDFVNKRLDTDCREGEGEVQFVDVSNKWPDGSMCT